MFEFPHKLKDNPLNHHLLLYSVLSRKHTMVLLTFFTLVVSIQLIIPSTQAYFYYYTNCTTGSSNYTQNSTYQSNLINVLNNLTSHALQSQEIFHHASFGRVPDRVYGLYLCRGDLDDPRYCSQCVLDARLSILQECPTQSSAIQWNENCTIRFSNVPIYQRLDVSRSTVGYNVVPLIPSEEVRAFLEVRNNTMAELVPRVANNGTKFGAEDGDITTSLRFNTRAQCTPDLSNEDCNRCLGIAVDQLQTRIGTWVLFPSCYVRFDLSIMNRTTAVMIQEGMYLFVILPPTNNLLIFVFGCLKIIFKFLIMDFPWRSSKSVCKVLKGGSQNLKSNPV